MQQKVCEESVRIWTGDSAAHGCMGEQKKGCRWDSVVSQQHPGAGRATESPEHAGPSFRPGGCWSEGRAVRNPGSLVLGTQSALPEPPNFMLTLCLIQSVGEVAWGHGDISRQWPCL